MGLLQEAFNEEIKALPRMVTEQIVTEKLATLGYDNSEMIERIVDHLMSDNELMEWDDGWPPIKLEFTKADLRHAATLARKITKAIPEVVKTMTREAGQDLSAHYREQWREQLSAMHASNDHFKETLGKRWGQALDELRLMLEVARDHGAEFHETFHESQLKRNRARNAALGRLHARSCQITAEIITLLENGYADGARARWRTLFEVSVVATIIADGGDSIAKRYLDHDAVDQKKAMDEYQKCAPLLGEKRFSAREIGEINKEYESALRRHGENFRHTNGWAADQPGFTPNPKFDQLQAVAGRISMRIYYKLASFGVHASSGAFSHQLSSFLEGVVVDGPSELGLAEPGENTANSLCLISSLLIAEPYDLDKLVYIQMLLRLRDATAVAFANAERELARDASHEQRRIMRLINSRINAKKGVPWRSIRRGRRGGGDR